MIWCIHLMKDGHRIPDILVRSDEESTLKEFMQQIVNDPRMEGRITVLHWHVKEPTTTMIGAPMAPTVLEDMVFWGWTVMQTLVNIARWVEYKKREQS